MWMQIYTNSMSLKIAGIKDETEEFIMAAKEKKHIQ